MTLLLIGTQKANSLFDLVSLHMFATTVK